MRSAAEAQLGCGKPSSSRRTLEADADHQVRTPITVLTAEEGQATGRVRPPAGLTKWIEMESRECVEAAGLDSRFIQVAAARRGQAQTCIGTDWNHESDTAEDRPGGVSVRAHFPLRRSRLSAKRRRQK